MYLIPAKESWIASQFGTCRTSKRLRAFLTHTCGQFGTCRPAGAEVCNVTSCLAVAGKRMLMRTCTWRMHRWVITIVFLSVGIGYRILGDDGSVFVGQPVTSLPIFLTYNFFCMFENCCESRPFFHGLSVSGVAHRDIYKWREALIWIYWHLSFFCCCDEFMS